MIQILPTSSRAALVVNEHEKCKLIANEIDSKAKKKNGEPILRTQQNEPTVTSILPSKFSHGNQGQGVT
jgi:hypothetical protein